jgi:hypothetical protein
MGSHTIINTENVGAPNDYSESLYRFYLEVVDQNSIVKDILFDFLGPVHGLSISDMPYGYEFDMPIQCAPEVVRNLSQANVAIYQLIRIRRVAGQWHLDQPSSNPS